MSDLNSLDIRHKRGVICYVMYFEIAIKRFRKFISSKNPENSIDDIVVEASEYAKSLSESEVHEIIK